MGVNLTYGSGNDRYKLQGAELNPIGTTYYNKHKERNISYNADRKPVDVHDVGNGRITFNYSHDGHRQELWYGGEDETKTDRQYHKTYSRIAPIELVRNTENNTVKFMTYVGGDAYTAPVVHVQDSDSSKPSGHHYLHRDYLGSILAVSNSSGKVIERAHFGAWGDEVLITTSDNATTARSDSLTGRGFTGHEHFTEVGLIHMNGRMYDAQQGRFLSPDNHIQDPFNTQNFNRFGYVLNNPLSLTDPSGEFIETLFAIVKVVSLIMTAAQTLIAIASGAPIGQVLIGIGIGVLAGLAGGALATGIKGLFSAATTAVGAFVRGAISAFGGQLISGTLASVAQGTSFRKALRANFAPAGIAAAAGGFAGASEFKANQKALSVAKAKRMVANELDAIAKENASPLSQPKDLEYYYEAVDGMTMNDGTVMSRDDFLITLDDDATGNARYHGFKNGKHHVNFDLSDYEITPDNIRATMIHEVYGHGIKGYSGGSPGPGIYGGTHHKAYFSTIDSKYWKNTTLTFKRFHARHMWNYYYWEVGYKPLPSGYNQIYNKYGE